VGTTSDELEFPKTGQDEIQNLNSARPSLARKWSASTLTGEREIPQKALACKRTIF